MSKKAADKRGILEQLEQRATKLRPTKEAPNHLRDAEINAIIQHLRLALEVLNSKTEKVVDEVVSRIIVDSETRIENLENDPNSSGKYQEISQ